MKKILIIPHHPASSQIKIRLTEIAKGLSKGYIVYLVNWKTALGEYSLYSRLDSALKDLCKKVIFYKKDKIIVMEFPVLHRPLCLAPGFNSFWLGRIVEKEKIDVVINGSFYMFNINKKRNFRYIFDIADLPVTSNSRFDEFVDRQVRREFEKADIITSASKGLVNYILNNYQKKSLFIPNGADLRKMRQVRQEDIANIKRKYNLYDKWVIGYIGQIGEWVNVGLTIAAFKEVKKYMPDAILLWVGLSPQIRRLKKLYESDDVLFTGGVDAEEVEAYFKVLDVGILPHRKSLFRDLAFHIKLIEYSAARKFVVSIPLEEVKTINFPNVLFSPENPAELAAAIKKTRQMQWQKEWDVLVEDYDWAKICQKFIEIAA